MAFFGLAVLLGPATLKSQSDQVNALDRYFKEYLDDDRFSVVYISPKVFQLLDRVSLGDVETDEAEARMVKDLAKDLRGLRILSTDETPRAFYEEAKKRIDTKAYELLMTVRRPKVNDLEFLIHEDAEGVINELLMISGGQESFTLLSFVGKIDLETVTRLGQELEKEN